MPLQTSITEEDVGKPGAPFDINNLDVDTRFAEVAMNYGDLAIRAATREGKGVKRAITAGATGAAMGVVGIVRYNSARSKGATTDYDIGDPMAVIRKGRVWVQVTAEVADGQQAAMVFNAVTGLQPASWSPTGTTDSTDVPGAKFWGTSKLRNGVRMAVVELDM